MRSPNFSSNPSRQHADSRRRSPSIRWSSQPPQLQRTNCILLVGHREFFFLVHQPWQLHAPGTAPPDLAAATNAK
ncbi:hypothetical protein DEO72_LG11g1571 [Vigna unguiculata]|uniref:Uncharacterized protein n=1 Tax=Vigna unguiculata TaxID=3917 RepID=A0A4D6NMK3_VIGUN|nr:hypothetical protein DEO72_LG11g1571 [Vigna unguiculata]